MDVLGLLQISGEKKRGSVWFVGRNRYKPRESLRGRGEVTSLPTRGDLTTAEFRVVGRAKAPTSYLSTGPVGCTRAWQGRGMDGMVAGPPAVARMDVCCGGVSKSVPKVHTRASWVVY